MAIDRIISRGIQTATKNIVRKATMTATQKTAAKVATKAAIVTSTTVGSMAINRFIQEKESTKIANEIKNSIDAQEKGEGTAMTEQDIAARAKKAVTKANIASGIVIGVGSAGSAFADEMFNNFL